jgi:hypothetical protein
MPYITHTHQLPDAAQPNVQPKPPRGSILVRCLDCEFQQLFGGTKAEARLALDTRDMHSFDCVHNVELLKMWLSLGWKQRRVRVQGGGRSGRTDSGVNLSLRSRPHQRWVRGALSIVSSPISWHKVLEIDGIRLESRRRD